MAKQITFIMADQRLRSVEGGAALNENGPIRYRYQVVDPEDSANNKTGFVVAESIDTTKTVADWWASIIAACEADAGISNE